MCFPSAFSACLVDLDVHSFAQIQINYREDNHTRDIILPYIELKHVSCTSLNIRRTEKKSNVQCE